MNNIEKKRKTTARRHNGKSEKKKHQYKRKGKEKENITIKSKTINKQMKKYRPLNLN